MAYAERKQRIYERLEPFERALAEAPPDSLEWSFWSLALELVELLPRGEQQAWKGRYMPTLRRAVRMPEEAGS